LLQKNNNLLGILWGHLFRVQALVPVLVLVLAEVQEQDLWGLDLRENQVIRRVHVLRHRHPADHRVMSDLLLLQHDVWLLLPLFDDALLPLPRVVEPLQLQLLRDVWLPLLLHV
jgi:hypothetical protein